MSTLFADPAFRVLPPSIAANASPGVLPSTRIERLMLMVIAFLLPFDDHFPTLGGISPGFFMFAFSACYVITVRGSFLLRIMWHPLFLTGMFSLLISIILETLHGDPTYSTLMRIGFMYCGGVLIAALSRDRKAALSVMYGIVTGGTVLSIMLITSSYWILAKASAMNFKKAGLVRMALADNVSVGGDLNMLAFHAAVGAAISLAIGMGQKTLLRRIIFIAAASVCAMGAFVPMSRGGIGVLALSSLVAMRARGLRLTTVVLFLMLGGLVLMFVPKVVFSRMSLSEGGRVRVYTALRDKFPEYALVGVGAGNYWNKWAYTHGISHTYGPLGTHNTFVQSLVYWGILGLAPLLMLVFLAWCYTPKACYGDELRVSLRTLAFSLLLYLFLSHTFQDKQYSVGLGLLAAGSRWIWSAGYFKRNFLPQVTR